MSDWVPTSERLPPTGVDCVIATTLDSGFRIGYYCDLGSKQDSYWRFSSVEWRWDTVTHWMPLPEPP